MLLPFAQVATYHYAIKRMDDQHTQEGERADAALDVRMWPAPPDAAQVGTFKLFLVQVTAGAARAHTAPARQR